MGFGIKLKNILKEKGITIKELAQISGISINTLYSITKRDTNIPSKEIIDKIVAALNIEASELLTLEIVSDEINSKLKYIEQFEKDIRQKLYEITERLNADAIYELLSSAIEMLKDESNYSIFCKKDKPDAP